MSKFKEYFLLREVVDRFQSDLEYLIESTNATQEQSLDEFIKIRPYIFGQMIVGILVAGMKAGLDKNKILDDLSGNAYSTVMERMSKLPEGGTPYSKLFEHFIKTTNFSVLWEKIIKEYFGKPEAVGSETQGFINEDPSILLDYISSEFDENILKPLYAAVENKTTEKVAVGV